LFAILLVVPAVAQAQRDAKIPDPDPELERRTFILPPGFEVNLWAADPLLAKPIQINFDARGRLWVAASEVYPQIRPGQQASDKILILEDTDGDGKADKTTVFADGLLIPTGLEPGDGGVYVADSTDIVHFSSSKGEGKADRRRVLLSGFGTEDTHHIIHTFRWGPDCRLYFNQSIYIHSHIETPYGVRRLGAGGVWQFRPATHQLEVFARGWINPWGHIFDRYGQSFVTDGAGGEGINYVVPGAAYPTAQGVARVLNGLNPGSPKYCGLEVLSGSHLPPEMQGQLVTHDFRGHRVCRFQVRENGSGYTSQQLPELIKSTHPAFRPIDVRMGPDGAIYVADWYNPIIQHGEVDFRDPRRDKTHGRIWRITYKGRPLVKRPKLAGATIEQLLNYLRAGEDWTRLQAKRQLHERGADKVLPKLRDFVAGMPDDAGHDLERLEALWVFLGFDVPEPALLDRLLRGKDGRVRAAAVRVLADWADRVPDAAKRLAAAVADEHPRVRLEAVCGLRKITAPGAVADALKALDRPMDTFLDYALWQTVRELQPNWLPAMTRGELTLPDLRHLTFAVRAAGAGEAVASVAALYRQGKVPADQAAGVLQLLASLGGAGELSLVFDEVRSPRMPADQARSLLESLAEATRSRRVRPSGDVQTIVKLMDHADEGIRAGATRLAGLWQVAPARLRLVELAGQPKTPDSVRRAAFDGLVAMGGPDARADLVRLTTTNFQPPVRRLAVVALATLDPTVAARPAVDLLEIMLLSADPSDIIAAFLAQKTGPDALANALKGRKIPADPAKLALRFVRTSGRNLPKLTDALTSAGGLATANREPSAEMVRELADAVLKQGDAARGEAIFRRRDLTCLKCHAIGGSGGQVGPDLTSIGASAQVDYLVDSILLPNKAVKEGYHTVVVETKRGKTFTGVKVRQSDKDLILRDSEDQEIRVLLADIESQSPGRSLMPDALADSFTRAELIDLVRFLSELGKVGPYQIGPARVVRRWQVLETNAPAYQQLTRVGLQAPATDPPGLTWSSAYSTVGGVLNVSEIPVFELRRGLEKYVLPVGVARCDIEASAAGKARLLMNSTTGLTLWLDGKPIEPQRDTTLELTLGRHRLTIVIDRRERRDGVRFELADDPGAAGIARPVGGK
jgi:putative heme-binding domain-containing protein